MRAPTREHQGLARRAAFPFLTADMLILPSGGREVESTQARGEPRHSLCPAMWWATDAQFSWSHLGTEESGKASQHPLGWPVIVGAEGS